MLPQDLKGILTKVTQLKVAEPAQAGWAQECGLGNTTPDV